MSQQRWNAVDSYIANVLGQSDPALDAALEATKAFGLPRSAVAPNQGKLLQILARSLGAKKILEIGSLCGYSTIWLARALPSDGGLVTLEYEPKHAEAARANIARAGLTDRVEVRRGRALDILPNLTGPFDFFFIDADKASIPDYFRWALKLSRLGSLIVVDNVIRDGAVIDTDSMDPNVQGVRQFNDLLADEPRVSATTIQTVGVKGHDGFTIALVVAASPVD